MTASTTCLEGSESTISSTTCLEDFGNRTSSTTCPEGSESTIANTSDPEDSANRLNQTWTRQTGAPQPHGARA